MELMLDIEIIQCPSCQGEKKIHWNDQEYPCRICGCTGEVELKEQAHLFADCSCN